jgi:hypothetical protein
MRAPTATGEAAPTDRTREAGRRAKGPLAGARREPERFRS